MEREYAHKLLDYLDAGQLEAVGRLIEVMVHPGGRTVAVPSEDDEPVTEEDIRAIREGELELAQGGGTPMQEFIAEFGLTMEDLHREIARLNEAVPGRVA